MADLELTTGPPNTYPVERVESSTHVNPDQKGKNSENNKSNKNNKKKLVQTTDTKDQVSTAQKQANINDKKETKKNTEPLEKGRIIDITI